MADIASPLEIAQSEQSFHLIAYHLVWATKRRKPVLLDEVAADCRAMITARCQQQGWQILGLDIAPDHVHLHLRVRPDVSAKDVLRACRSATAAPLPLRHPALKRLPSLWSGPFLASVTAPNPVVVELFPGRLSRN